MMRAGNHRCPPETGIIHHLTLKPLQINILNVQQIAGVILWSNYAAIYFTVIALTWLRFLESVLTAPQRTSANLLCVTGWSGDDSDSRVRFFYSGEKNKLFVLATTDTASWLYVILIYLMEEKSVTLPLLWLILACKSVEHPQSL